MNFLQFVMPSIWKFSLAFQLSLWYHLWLTLITLNFVQFCETLIRLGPFYVKASGFYSLKQFLIFISIFSHFLTLIERIFVFVVYQDMWIIWDCIHKIMYTWSRIHISLLAISLIFSCLSKSNIRSGPPKSSIIWRVCTPYYKIILNIVK